MYNGIVVCDISFAFDKVLFRRREARRVAESNALFISAANSVTTIGDIRAETIESGSVS